MNDNASAPRMHERGAVYAMDARDGNRDERKPDALVGTTARIAGSNVEVELKLRIAPADAKRILGHPALEDARLRHSERIRMHATYVDTPDAVLMQRGLALRLRKEGQRWVQTLKGPAPGSAPGMHARREFESPRGREPSLDLDDLSSTPWADVLAEAAPRLAPIFETSFARDIVPLAFADGTHAELVLDRGEIRSKSNPGSSQRICELEIELEEGSLLAIYELAQSLAADVPLAVETRSKAERGYMLATGTAARPERARPPALAPDSGAGDAVRAILGECTSQIARNADIVALHASAEAVHQMRVGLRRLRSALAMLRRQVDANRLAPLENLARWFAKALGEARDLHVMRHDALPRIVKDIADPASRRQIAAVVERLGPGLERAEARAVRDARRVARSRVLHRFLLDLGAFACELPRESPDDREAPLSRRASDFAVSIFDERHERLRKLARNLAAASPRRRHEARIAAKRLRYAVEFFGSLFPLERIDPFVDALSRLQDALGHDNDAREAVRAVARTSRPPSESMALLERAAYAGQRARTRAIVKAWSRFAACGRCWRDTGSRRAAPA